MAASCAQSKTQHMQRVCAESSNNSIVPPPPHVEADAGPVTAERRKPNSASTIMTRDVTTEVPAPLVPASPTMTRTGDAEQVKSPGRRTRRQPNGTSPSSLSAALWRPRLRPLPARVGTEGHVWEKQRVTGAKGHAHEATRISHGRHARAARRVTHKRCKRPWHEGSLRA